VSEFEKDYFKNIQSFLKWEKEAGKIIYPEEQNIFAAFNTTPLNKLKVVILGQDPYHGAWQAHWLSFSVQEGVKVPPSLRNIYKELKMEYPDYNIPSSWNLEHWANQWVLLINSILTVEASKPASHSTCGWGDFTDAILQKLSDSQEWIIFILWGNFSIWKKVLINENKHFILESSHPSPFSAHRGFLWNGHFKEINRILEQEWRSKIKW
jgi:uracil-DNA glycosylase